MPRVIYFMRFRTINKPYHCNCPRFRSILALTYKDILLIRSCHSLDSSGFPTFRAR